MRILPALFLSPFCIRLQPKKQAVVTGRVIDENDRPIAKVSVVILGKTTGTITSDSGTFSIKVPSGKAFAIVFPTPVIMKCKILFKRKRK